MESGNRPNEWERVRAVLDEALIRPPGDRVPFVQEACEGDKSLEAEVLSLLQAEVGSEAYFQALGDAVSGPNGGGGMDRWVGTRLEGYELLDRIGVGGMSSVYRARRVDGGEPEFVAIKMLDVSITSLASLQRFALEQEGLRSLDHPGIVSFLEGGTTEEGSRWFAMDFVEGESIERFADGRRLGLDERISLVLSVGEVVSHAHARGILHRDLKPSNILVTSEGKTILLDFGVAKLLDREGGGAPSDLTMEMRAFTPRYASPEQVLGEPVSEASDVYSLGILLYELLAGAPPPMARGGGVPRVPLRVLEGLGPGALAVAEARGTEVDSLKKALGGGITRILTRACHTEPASRYASVEALSKELRGYLAGERAPISLSLRLRGWMAKVRSPWARS